MVTTRSLAAKPPGVRLRSTARYAVLNGLAIRDQVSGRTVKALSRPRVHMIYFHSIPQSEEPQFRRLLNLLASRHTFVSYGQAAELLRFGKIDRPYVAFSFDDGFASNRRTAAILEEYGTTGCFFIPPAFVGCPDAHAARQFFGQPDVDEGALTWDEIEQMVEAGHEIGNHTRHHYNISTVSSDRLGDEIAHAADTLESRLGMRPEHFAWPLGRFHHFSDTAARIVFDSGHRTCASAERGAHVASPSSNRFCLRRDHIMTAWPLRHSVHFLTASAFSASASTNDWPSGWSVDNNEHS